MEFKKFSAGKFAYGKSDSKADHEKLKEIGVTNVCFEDPLIEEHINNY